jgi:hypothetical protein
METLMGALNVSRRAAALVALGVLGLTGCSLINLTDADPAGPLAIQRFVAVPEEIEAGEPTILSWDVEGAESIEIDNGVGLVPASGSRTVRPLATTSYLLVAVADTSLATSSVRVVVAPAAPAPSP